MPELFVDIVARFAKFQQGLDTIQSQTASTAKRIEHAFDGVEKAIKLAFVGAEIKRFASEVYDVTIRAEKAQQQLQATLQATGHAAGKTADELNELAEHHAKITLFDDEDIRQAEVALLRFRDIQGKVFDDALTVTIKLAVAQGGTAAAAAETLGRALEDPIGGLKGLRGVMVPLTQTQKDLISGFERTGDKAGSAQIILDNLNKSLGDAPNGGLAGNAHRASLSYEEFLKTVGKSPAVGATAGSIFETMSNTLKVLDEDLERVARSEGLAKLKEILQVLETLTTGHRAKKDPLPDPLGDLTKGTDEFIAKQGEARQKLEQRLEAARRAAAEEKLVNEATAKAGHDAQFKEAKAAADLALQVLDDAYQQGLVKTRDYYDERIRISRNKTAQELEANQRSIDTTTDKKASTPEERAAKAGELVKLDAERVALLRAQAAEEIKLDEERAVATQKLIDTQTELSAVIAEQNGHLEEAARLRHGIESRPQRIAFAQGDFPDDELVKQAQRVAAQGRFNAALLERDAILSELGRNERAIANEVERGELTSQGALEKTDAARKQAIIDQQRYIEILERAARVAPTAANKEALAEAKQALDDLGAHAQLVAGQMRSVFEDAFVSPFEDLVNHVKTADEALKAFFNNIAQSLLHLASKNIAESLFGGLFKTSSTNNDTGIFSLFSSVGGILSGLGGASKGAVTTDAQAGITTQQYTDYFKKAKGGIVGPLGDMPLQRFAAGGIARHPMLAEFGEGSTPEAYVPLADGRSIPVTMKTGGWNAPTQPVLQAASSAMGGKPPVIKVVNQLNIDPSMMHLTLEQWFEGQLARIAATR